MPIQIILRKANTPDSQLILMQLMHNAGLFMCFYVKTCLQDFESCIEWFF